MVKGFEFKFYVSHLCIIYLIIILIICVIMMSDNIILEL